MGRSQDPLPARALKSDRFDPKPGSASYHSHPRVGSPSTRVVPSIRWVPPPASLPLLHAPHPRSPCGRKLGLGSLEAESSLDGHHPEGVRTRRARPSFLHIHLLLQNFLWLLIVLRMSRTPSGLSGPSEQNPSCLCLPPSSPFPPLPSSQACLPSILGALSIIPP